jgi:hypothetical protein
MATTTEERAEQKAELARSKARAQADRLFSICSGCGRERRLVSADGNEFRAHRRYVQYEIRQGLSNLPGRMEPCLPEPVADLVPAFIGEGDQ